MWRHQTDTVSNKISKLPYKHVDAVARFPQGNFNNYIEKKLEYNHHVNNTIQGQIVLLMSIGADGSITNSGILKSLSPAIDPEVIRIVGSSPKWHPATLNGQNVAMDMVLTIDIAIKGIQAFSAPTDSPKKARIVQQRIVLPPIKQPSTSVIDPKVPQLAKNSPVSTSAPLKVPTLKHDRPAIAKTTVSLAANRTVSPIIKKASLIIEKKTAPYVNTKPTAPVFKKPIAVIAKKAPLAVIKKTETPIVKKPAPVIAKKIAAPVIKKPNPVSLKQPVSPVIAKKKIPVTAKKTIQHAVKNQSINVTKKPLTDATPVAEPLSANTVPQPHKNKKRVTVQQDLFKDKSNNARFPGGLSAFFKYLGANITYPPGSKAAGIHGQVHLSFVVEEDGSINDVEIISSPAEDLGQEAVRVLLASPKWKPGIQNGKAVPVSFQIPITFTLLDKTPNPQ